MFEDKNGFVFNLGFGEIALVLVVALIFLGPKMLPEVATSLGKIIREIRKATADIRQDIELDEMIRRPLQELRDAATLPPEELKRRDEAKAARQKAEEEARRKQREEREKQAAEAASKAEAAKLEAEAKTRTPNRVATADYPTKTEPSPDPAPAPASVVFSPDAVSRGGTMIASPPPSNDEQTLTPVLELATPAPVMAASPPPRLPPPLPPPTPRPSGAMKVPVPAEATVFDLQAQLKASADNLPKIEPATASTSDSAEEKKG